MRPPTRNSPVCSLSSRADPDRAARALATLDGTDAHGRLWDLDRALLRAGIAALTAPDRDRPPLVPRHRSTPTGRWACHSPGDWRSWACWRPAARTSPRSPSSPTRPKPSSAGWARCRCFVNSSACGTTAVPAGPRRLRLRHWRPSRPPPWSTTDMAGGGDSICSTCGTERQTRREILHGMRHALRGGVSVLRRDPPSWCQVLP